MNARSLTFGVIGADSTHIYPMAREMVNVGATFKGWWTKDEPETVQGRIDPFPGTPRLKDRRELLDDPNVELVLIAAKPADRARLSIEAMEHGKDVMSDKPGALSLEEVAALRRTAAATGRFWSVNYSERTQVRAFVKAAQLIEQGAIGQVVQTMGIGPHQAKFWRRPGWYFNPRESGGIMGDMAGHQIDHFLVFTGSTKVDIVTASVGNFGSPQYPVFEDFGEIVLHGDRGLGYVRVDWYTPDVHPYPGDGRFMVFGTQGQIEIRKYADVGGRPGGDHVFLIGKDYSDHVDCSDVALTYFANVANDVRDRTETAMRREHSFLVTELAIKADAQAIRLGHLGKS